MSLNDYYEDLPELARGRLDPQRASEILRAAENDPELRRAIQSERALDQVLALYESPEPAAGLQGAFWRRFHQDKAQGRSRWMLRLVGPLAAGVLLTIGVIAFYKGDTQPATQPVTADQPQAPESATEDDSIDWDDLRYFAEVSEPRKLELDAQMLRTLRELDSEAFRHLDGITQPDDLRLVDELELLQRLDRAEGR